MEDTKLIIIYGEYMYDSEDRYVTPTCIFRKSLVDQRVLEFLSDHSGTYGKVRLGELDLNTAGLEKKIKEKIIKEGFWEEDTSKYHFESSRDRRESESQWNVFT